MPCVCSEQQLSTLQPPISLIDEPTWKAVYGLSVAVSHSRHSTASTVSSHSYITGKSINHCTLKGCTVGPSKSDCRCIICVGSQGTSCDGDKAKSDLLFTLQGAGLRSHLDIPAQHKSQWGGSEKCGLGSKARCLQRSFMSSHLRAENHKVTHNIEQFISVSLDKDTRVMEKSQL